MYTHARKHASTHTYNGDHSGNILSALSSVGLQDWRGPDVTEILKQQNECTWRVCVCVRALCMPACMHA